jgi:hypothetical protein
MVHRSKVDPWLRLLLMAAVGLSLVAALTLVENSPSPATLMAAAPLLALGAALPLWILFDTVYRIEGGVLHVRSGPFRWRAPLAEITGVSDSRSPVSAPALSLTRLRIDFGRGPSLLVSPEDPDAFCANLRAGGANTGPT